MCRASFSLGLCVLGYFSVNGLLLVDDINKSFGILSNNPNDVHFYLFPFAGNPDYSEEIILNDQRSLFSSQFQPGCKTDFIIHGFRENVNTDMSQTVKNAYLDSGLNHNYIVVSWGALSTPKPQVFLNLALYPLVTFNVPIVASRVAEFISFLYNNGALSFNDIHLIGHSLGAHISGLTGLYIQQMFGGQQISRITGLDPAGPLFYPNLKSRNLVKTDAQFVDVIHTNLGKFGDITVDGHADFYPNGGAIQPGCAQADLIGDPAGDVNNLGGCSHLFAYRLYAASMKNNFTACKCNSILPNSLGITCFGNCLETATLGLYCNPITRGQYQLTTPSLPYSTPAGNGRHFNGLL